MRLIRAFPAGGQADCLCLLARDGGPGDVRLNRHGTLQVVARFDRLPVTGPEFVAWADYLRADHRAFVRDVEAQAWLPAQARTPAATPVTLTCRVLAALAATGFKTGPELDIDSGYLDTAGYPRPQPGVVRRVPADRPRAAAAEAGGLLR